MAESGKFLVTGANGFIGSALCAALRLRGYPVRTAVRGGAVSDMRDSVAVGEITGGTNWSAGLNGVDTVIHLAARVHVMHDKSADPLAEFRSVNTGGAEHLARCAATSGVKRLVYISSIGVNGLQTTLGKPFSETDDPHPHNAYALSKWEAEQSLSRVSEETGLEVVIVRPPLVYGAGAPGNFALMLKVLVKGIPLPLASVNNLRSLVYVENLVDALIACATHPAAAGQTYLISDGEDISTPDLLRQLGAAMGHPAKLFSCPPILLKLAGHLTGKTEQVERLLGSLRVDSGKIRHDLNWVPPCSLQQGLRATAEWHRTKHT